MRKTIFLVLFFALCLWTMDYGLWTKISFSQDVEEKETDLKQVIVYSDEKAAENSFSPSEWIGDKKDLSFSPGWEMDPKEGKSCIRIDYTATGSYGWAGIYWVNPKGNWGNQRGGYDLRFAEKLTFWVKGEKGGEHIAVFKFGGLKGVFPDSDNHGIGPIVLTKDWQQLSIDVSQRNMKYISAGFSFALSKAYNKSGCVFYIDDVKFE